MTESGMRQGAPPNGGTPCLRGNVNAGSIIPPPHRDYPGGDHRTMKASRTIRVVLSTTRPQPCCCTNILRDSVACLKPLAHFLKNGLVAARIFEGENNGEWDSFRRKLRFRTHEAGHF